MTVTVKCDQTETFDFDTCIQCKRFTLDMTDKGRRWRCSLNRGTAAEKRRFQSIWALDFLVNRGVFPEDSRDNVVIDFVGRRKKGAK
jgi:hypothetical protein